MNQFKEIFRYKLIYIFEINDAAHKGLLKIGDTSINTTKFLSPNSSELNQAAKNRIKKYTTTAGINFNLLHTELAVKDNAQSFRDYNVHKVLIRSGYKKKPPQGSNAKEWFKVDLETAKQAISAVKQNKKTVGGADSETFIPISFRPEQERAINLTVQNFKKNNKMLWNAKMRFGKTLCALEVVRRMKFSKTVIVTHRPVVNEGWYEDFSKIFHDNNNFAYSSKNRGESVENLLKGNKNFVYFASIQDLRGSDTVGGKFDKNLEIFGTDWDFVIVDEAHEGTTTALGESVIKNLVGKNTKFLALSGTPFNIVEDYDPQETFTWDYIDEQQAKADWDKNNGGDSNPYAELPQLNIFTYNLGELLNNPDFFDEDKTFNFKEFFRTNNNGKFIHEKHIKNFLELLTKNDAKSNYPYSNEQYRNLFRHTLWIIPGVKEGRALSNLLKEHFIFQNFKILNIAGTEDEGSADPQKTLEEVKNAIAENKRTITLSCGKLTTGVTVPEWTAVFMLAGSSSTSAASYMQTIFRVQSPYNIGGKFKENCYVFDFAPDRTLKIISESLAIYGKSQIKDTLKNFLHFCPVIAVEGSIMKEYNAPKLMQTLKRVYAERAVRHGFDDSNLYNEKLFQLDYDALKNFEKLKAIIGTSKAQEKTKTIPINRNGTNKGTNTKGGGKKDPNHEQLLKQRRAAISILRGISIRIPLMIYGADIPIDEDFKIEMLTEIDNASWDEFMPRGVTKKIFKDFIQYYDEDIFIAAGHEIRNIAKKADDLTPTERVKKIAELFSYFKNPDKETVLTSWRVVNLHLSSALGGFDFFDDNHENILPDPRFVSQGKITADTLANSNAHILEINSKTGLYPLYVAYSLYRERLGKVKESKFELHTLQHLWDKTLQENIFVICKTPMAKDITFRTLAGFRHKNLNANYFENLIQILKSTPENFINNILSQNYWNKGAGTMKFDAVVGNPPYQIMQEGGNENYSSPIYHEFLKVSFKLNAKVTMIHPARCFFNAGNTPEEFNKKILHEKHLKIIKYEVDSSKFFPNTDIKGGIVITYYDPDPKIDFGFIGLFIPFEELKSIYHKVVADSKNFLPINKIVYGRSQYRLTEKFIEENPNADFIKARRNDFFKTNVFEFAKDYFFDEKPNDGKEYIQVWGLIKNKRYLKFIRADYINVGENKINFYDYKIIIPEANGSGAIGEKLSTPLVGLPLVGLPLVGNTQTFITLGAFDTEAEAANALKFVKTKFARALLGVLKVTQHNPPETWACVPLQDFTANSDIDWSRSVPEIDAQLYKKYNLDDAEINFIEEKVKAME